MSKRSRRQGKEKVIRISKRNDLLELRPKGKNTKNSFWKRFKTYQDYLKSDEWKSIKKIHFGNGTKVCIGCRSKKDIHVHHRSYNRLGSVNEVKDLVTVCVECHTKIHDIEKKQGITVRRATSIVLGSIKSIRKKQKGKQQIKKPNKRLIHLRTINEVNKKDKLIRELRLNGINGNFTNLPYLTVLKLSKKYI